MKMINVFFGLPEGVSPRSHKIKRVVAHISEEAEIEKISIFERVIGVHRGPVVLICIHYTFVAKLVKIMGEEFGAVMLIAWR